MDDKSKAAVLAVTIRDLTKFTFDEDGANWLTIKAPGPPWTKRPKGEEMQMHFRHRYEVPWQTWPNANEIWGNFTKKIIKNLHKAQTIGYKGRIPAKDIELFASYKPKGMKMHPDNAEFDAARAETMATWSPGQKTAEPSKKPHASRVAMLRDLAAHADKIAPEHMKVAVDAVMNANKDQQPSASAAPGKTYKVYGKKGSSPAHTRFKGKAYVAGKDTKFRSGDSATVTPKDGKLQVKSTTDDHTQMWDAEE
jgi:hypothetical protein